MNFKKIAGWLIFLYLLNAVLTWMYKLIDGDEEEESLE
jgi:hypothetical protein